MQACRNRYLEDGLCMLPAFLRPEGLETLVEEVNGCVGDAWFCDGTHDVYLAQDDPGVPAGAVAGLQERTFVGSRLTIGSERTPRCYASICGNR
ncbi:MAG: hypothetical protein OXU21_02665 [Chloroflexota bacterium]|nr:hypothetical protein [Chloroflexota bacterium]